MLHINILLLSTVIQSAYFLCTAYLGKAGFPKICKQLSCGFTSHSTRNKSIQRHSATNLSA